MIESTVDPRLAAQQADTSDLVRFKQKMDGLKDRLTTGETKEAQLKEACQNFEAVFISKLWQQMKQSVPKEGYLHSKQEDSYMAMFDRDFAEKMAKAGGIGLADMIYAQLSEKLKEVSKTTLSGGVDIRPLVAQPIPLDKGGAPLTKESKGMTLEDWGGEASMDVSSSSRIAPAVRDVAAASTGSKAEPRQMTDLEVRARLDSLVRRIEAEHLGSTVAEADLATEGDG
jgi:flagellar protein FlgJ